MNVPSTPPPNERPQRSTLALVALGGVAALVLVIGFLVWAGGRDDDTLTSPPTSEPVDTTTPSDTATTVPETSMPSPTTTSAPAPTTTTTEPPPPTTTEPPPPSGATWTATSAHHPDRPFTMSRVAEAAGAAAYDGAIDVEGGPIRCVAIVLDGVDRWQEWCGQANLPVRFVALAGIDPWIVDVGAEVGDVTLEQQEPTWVLRSNGCASPVATIAGTVGLRAQVTTGLVCVGDEAFVGFAGVLLQDGGPDGGGALLALGDEGWNVIDGGTSVPCRGSADGVDRCESFGVGEELFEAALPIPSADLAVSSPNSIDVRDETATVRGWIGGAGDPDSIEAAALGQLEDPEAEAPVATRRGTGAGGYTLLLLDVPALDDSVLSTTWAIWIDSDGLARATAWETCARGVTGGLCV